MTDISDAKKRLAFLKEKSANWNISAKDSAYACWAQQYGEAILEELELLRKEVQTLLK